MMWPEKEEHMMQKELFYAAMGTGATCLATVLGAAYGVLETI